MKSIGIEITPHIAFNYRAKLARKVVQAIETGLKTSNGSIVASFSQIESLLSEKAGDLSKDSLLEILSSQKFSNPITYIYDQVSDIDKRAESDRFHELF